MESHLFNIFSAAKQREKQKLKWKWKWKWNKENTSRATARSGGREIFMKAKNHEKKPSSRLLNGNRSSRSLKEVRDRPNKVKEKRKRKSVLLQ